MKKSILIVAVLVLQQLGSAAFAQSSAESKLKIIYQAASSICGDYEYDGESAGFSGTGELDARLEDLANRLQAEGEIDDAQLNTQSFRGLVQEQLGDEFKSVRACRERVFEVFVDELKSSFEDQIASLNSVDEYFERSESKARPDQAKAFVMGYMALYLIGHNGTDAEREQNASLFRLFAGQLGIPPEFMPQKAPNAADVVTPAIQFMWSGREVFEQTRPELAPYFVAPLKIIVVAGQGDSERISQIAQAIDAPQHLWVLPPGNGVQGDVSHVIPWFGQLGAYYFAETI